MWKSLRFVLILWTLLLGGARVAAEPVVLDPDRVLSLAEEPWVDRDQFIDRLQQALGPLQLDTVALPPEVLAEDPFLWSVTGRFGAPLDGAHAAGGIVACSRYGQDTRDRLGQSALSDPSTFILFGATLAASDDAAAWPAAGLARLACMITWDDTRRVAIIDESPARAALADRFATIAVTRDATGAGEGQVQPVYGTRGYRLDATDGPRNSASIYDRARIELRVSHQVIRFRSFLINGGM